MKHICLIPEINSYAEVEAENPAEAEEIIIKKFGVLVICNRKDAV